MNNTFDSEYQIQQSILTKLGGAGTKCFDSQYSILLEILDKIEGVGSVAKIDDNTISTTTTWSSSKIVSELANVDASLANKANISYVDTNFAKLSVLTQAQYDALTSKDSSTLYIISDAQ